MTRALCLSALLMGCLDGTDAGAPRASDHPASPYSTWSAGENVRRLCGEPPHPSEDLSFAGTLSTWRWSDGTEDPVRIFYEVEYQRHLRVLERRYAWQDCVVHLASLTD